MATRTVIMPPTRGRFSQRSSAGIGGNDHAGAFHEFPLGGRAANCSQFFEYFNDFLSAGDFYIEVFTGATGTVPTPDWIGADLGAAASSANALLTDTPYGVLKVTAGTADVTGRQVTRSPSGTNVAVPTPLASSTISAGNSGYSTSSFRRFAFGFRLAFAEEGTATQSVFGALMSRDENAVVTAATGAPAGAGQFGFQKPVGSNTIGFYSRNTATGTAVSVGTITPTGTVAAAPGTFIEVSALCLLTSADFRADIFLNRTLVQNYRTTTATQMPAADNYGPTFYALNGTGADSALFVDYYWTMVDRA